MSKKNNDKRLPISLNLKGSNPLPKTTKKYFSICKEKLGIIPTIVHGGGKAHAIICRGSAVLGAKTNASNSIRGALRQQENNEFHLKLEAFCHKVRKNAFVTPKLRPEGWKSEPRTEKGAKMDRKN